MFNTSKFKIQNLKFRKDESLRKQISMLKKHSTFNAQNAECHKNFENTENS